MSHKGILKRIFQKIESTSKNLAKVNENGETSTKKGSEIKCFKCFG